MHKNDKSIDTFACVQNFANFDGSGSSLSTSGFKIIDGLTYEQSVAKDWDKKGTISYKGVSDIKISTKLASLGNSSMNLSSRSRFTYNNDNSAFAQRIAIGIDVPVSKNVSIYATPNSVTTVNFKSKKISEPTLSIYSGINTKFKIHGKDCSLTVEGQAYDLIKRPFDKSTTSLNMMFKMNF